MVTFGDRLREIRNEKTITLEKMAKDLETTKATLSRYENNLREPKVDFLNKVADYFNVTTDYLLLRTNDKNSYIIKVDDFEFEIDKTKQDNDKNKQIKLKLKEILDLFPDEE